MSWKGKSDLPFQDILPYRKTNPARMEPSKTPRNKTDGSMRAFFLLGKNVCTAL